MQQNKFKLDQQINKLLYERERLEISGIKEGGAAEQLSQGIVPQISPTYNEVINVSKLVNSDQKSIVSVGSSSTAKTGQAKPGTEPRSITPNSSQPVPLSPIQVVSLSVLNSDQKDNEPTNISLTTSAAKPAAEPITPMMPPLKEVNSDSETENDVAVTANNTGYARASGGIKK